MASPNLSATSASASAAASSSVGSGARQITDIRAPLWDHVAVLEKPNLVEEIYYGDATIIHFQKALATQEY